MTSQYITEILGKLGELRSLFVLGQRALPFLEELFTFLQEISPLLDEINASMRDTTTVKMPRATSQLQSVSQATELATTEILDLIDAVLLKSGQEKERLQQAAARVESLAEVDARLLALLQTARDQMDEALLARIEALHAEKIERTRTVAASLRADVGTIDEIRDKMNRIMMSLQVQDITTQQIAAVNHLIESIRGRLAVLTERLGATRYEAVIETLPLPGTFDGNARYEWSGNRQKLADGLVADYQPGAAEAPSGPASQSDIDQLFGDGVPAEPAPPVPASQGDIDALFSAPSGPASQSDIDGLFGAALAPSAGPASQDDIDQLFGAPPTPASQDDIDALFGS
jgi:chemotaxis regulatin CheY-phosphate phosphatase CheZ